MNSWQPFRKFFHFPHDLPVYDNIGSSSAIIKDNWKFIKYYFANEGRHKYVLYNLNDKITERRNLYAQKQILGKQLLRQLENNLKNSGALIPNRNAKYNPLLKPEIRGSHFENTGLSKK